MIHDVIVEGLPSPARIRCAADSLLLDGMVAAGLPIAYCCRAGLCGMCKAQLSAGSVEHDSCSDRALSAAERAIGRILTCRAMPRSACTLRPLTQLGVNDETFSGYLAEVLSVERLQVPIDAELRTIRLKVDARAALAAWQPGHWGVVDTLSGESSSGPIPACYAGTDRGKPDEVCLVAFDVRSSDTVRSVTALEGAHVFVGGPRGSPMAADIEAHPFALLADRYGLAFVGALAWRAATGAGSRARAVVCADVAPLAGATAPCDESALADAWVAASRERDWPAQLMHALAGPAQDASLQGSRLRVVARGSSAFQSSLRHALRGTGVRAWDVSVESILELDRFPEVT